VTVSHFWKRIAFQVSNGAAKMLSIWHQSSENVLPDSERTRVVTAGGTTNASGCHTVAKSIEVHGQAESGRLVF